MYEDLTLAIATCGRPRVLRRCLQSIEKFVSYPHKIIVLDNTKAFTDEVNNDWVKDKVSQFIEVSDRKIGCCESNQLMVDACDTKYIMHLDDDIYFDKPEVVTKMMAHMVNNNEDVKIVSCVWKDLYYKAFREANIKHIIGESNGKKTFWKVSMPINIYKKLGIDVVESDEALHSMIIDMNLYKYIQWDKEFSWKGDREDFFLQVRKMLYKIHIMLDVYVVHDPKPFKYGSLSYEFDGKGAKKYFEKKWEMIPLFNWDKYQDKPR